MDADFRDNHDLSATDKAYVAQVVAARTGLSQADAEKRVNDVITEAKTAADNARKGCGKAFLLADCRDVVRSIRGKPGGGRRRLAARRYLERPCSHPSNNIRSASMGRGILLWLLGVPIPIIILSQFSFTDRIEVAPTLCSSEGRLFCLASELA